ncbi:MAG: MFS transporter [Rhodocyclaceae bacterium]
MSSARPSPAMLALLCGGAVLMLSLGIRHGFGLFLKPMSMELGWGREAFAFAIALQNLVWGLSQPITGALADRYGAWKAVAAGGLCYALGLLVMAYSTSPWSLGVGAGVLVGLGLSGTSFSVIYGVLGRAFPPSRRSQVLGIAGAAGSFGQFVLLPVEQGLISDLGWFAALLAAAFAAAFMVPLSAGVAEPADAHRAHGLTVREALAEAAGERDFWLLCFGFFVCGFQVVFIQVHLPAYLVDGGLSGNVGVGALALIGAFNIFGTYAAGRLGATHRKPMLLSYIYALRGVVIGLFLLAPLSAWSAWLFAAAMGLLWLSTVPLTNGTIASQFGVRHLSMLSGIVFLFHQIGSFAGAWFGGFLYDRTGSYSAVWAIAIALSVMATLLNWPIRERALGAMAREAA